MRPLLELGVDAVDSCGHWTWWPGGWSVLAILPADSTVYADVKMGYCNFSCFPRLFSG